MKLLLLLLVLTNAKTGKVVSFEINGVSEGSSFTILINKDGSFTTMDLPSEPSKTCEGNLDGRKTKTWFKELKTLQKEINLLPVESTSVRNHPAYEELYHDHQYWIVLITDKGGRLAAEDIGSYLKLRNFARDFDLEFRTLFETSSKNCTDSN